MRVGLRLPARLADAWRVQLEPREQRSLKAFVHSKTIFTTSRVKPLHYISW